ncbi:hypothetical protein WGC_03832 [Escherichia coli KTE41]|nr:hypothetical protein WGC_03832 [Escherichia coli KTE41]
MLSIILTGHGGFASGMEKAMKQILGEQSQFIAIDFPETEHFTDGLHPADVLLPAGEKSASGAVNRRDFCALYCLFRIRHFVNGTRHCVWWCLFT